MKTSLNHRAQPFNTNLFQKEDFRIFFYIKISIIFKK
jgi:hypothetical protein